MLAVLGDWFSLFLGLFVCLVCLFVISLFVWIFVDLVDAG